MKKLKVLVSMVVFALSQNLIAQELLTEEPIAIEVYRSPSCSCCGQWLTHLQQNQFVIKDHLMDDMAMIKSNYAVPMNLASCHTAVAKGYVIEGHVPAADIKKLIETKPNIMGLSVPGMPVGTPGMEMGGRVDSYDVVSFDKEGHHKVFNHYEGK